MTEKQRGNELAAFKQEFDKLRSRQNVVEQDLQELKNQRQGVIDALSEHSGLSRRAVVGLVSAVGISGAVSALASEGALADASTSDGDGDVGTPSNRVDVFADAVDFAGLPGVPLADQEAGSPYTAAGATSINISSLEPFDSYLLFVRANEQAGSGGDISMQINGDTGANYRETLYDGTEDTGQTEIGPLAGLQSNGVASFWIIVGQDFDGRATINNLGGGSSTQVNIGRRDNGGMMSSIEFSAGVSTDWEVRVWGREAGN